MSINLLVASRAEVHSFFQQKSQFQPEKKEGEKPIDIQTSERVERLKEPEVEVLENAQKPQQRRLAKKMPLPSE